MGNTDHLLVTASSSMLDNLGWERTNKGSMEGMRQSDGRAAVREEPGHSGRNELTSPYASVSCCLLPADTVCVTIAVADSVCGGLAGSCICG
mmetsp:Transcript_67096/g.132286  ORF Transcript_67096/g.132286 Transcript_67096/m.132286 type:complete len:92 (-) Transcript_67096:6-281(-)